MTNRMPSAKIGLLAAHTARFLIVSNYHAKGLATLDCVSCGSGGAGQLGTNVNITTCLLNRIKIILFYTFTIFVEAFIL